MVGSVEHATMTTLRTSWLSECRVDGAVAVKVGRRGSDLLVEFAGIGTFAWSRRGGLKQVTPDAGVPVARLNKLSASLVDALGRHLEGKITLHGAAVRRGSEAIALVGPSGAGKSTLAAALCATPGLQLVADDTIAIELLQHPDRCADIEIVPTQTEAWLLPEARRALGFDATSPNKVPIAVSSKSVDRIFLTAVVYLVFDGDKSPPVLRQLRGHQAFSILSSSAIRLVVDEPAAQLREFDQLRLLVERCPIWELRRSNNLAQLGLSADRVREVYGGLSATERGRR
jgi:hypothetical protein